MKNKKFIAILIVLTMMIIPKVNAASTTYNYEIKYNETNQQKINDNLDKIQAIKTYVEQNCLGQYCPLNGSYVLSIQLPTIDTGDFLVRLHNFSYNSNGNGDMSTYWASNQYGTGGNLRFATTMYYQTFRFVNGVLQRQSTASVGSTTITYTIDTNVCDPNNADCIMTGNYYWDTSYLDDRTFFTVKSGCTGVTNCKEVPILISNDDNHIYTVNEHLPVKDFFDNFNIIPEIEPVESSCPNIQIANISAPNNFTTGGTAIINKDSEIVWHEINIDTDIGNNTNVPNDYWEVLSYRGGENRELYQYFYRYNCEVIIDTENNNNNSFHCNIKYYFTTDSEENIEANAVFVIKRNTNYSSNLLTNTIVSGTNCDLQRVDTTTNWNNNVTSETDNNNWWNNITNTLSNIFNFLNPSNLIYLIVPTENQMQSLLNEMQESINNKLGILGLPITIYTRFMNLANTETQQNWCINWDSIKVPNFEENEIIASGSWCFNSILENEKINNFRVFSINIIGGLILLAFIQYLNNTYHKVIDSPDRDEYEYITTEDLYDVDRNTGELTNHRWLRKSTRREKIDK